jgi:hypothetical protein
MMFGRAVVLGALAPTVSASVSAQWLDRPTPGIPRTKDEYFCTDNEVDTAHVK